MFSAPPKTTPAPTSAEALKRAPELRPIHPEAAAQKDVRAAGGFFVRHASAVHDARDWLRAGEVALEEFAIEPDGDHGLRRRVAVAAGPEGIRAADRLREPVSRAVEIDRAGFAVISGEKGEAGLFAGRDGVAHLRDGGAQFRPADFFGEIAVVLDREIPPGGSDRRERQNDRADQSHIGDEEERGCGIAEL